MHWFVRIGAFFVFASLNGLLPEFCENLEKHGTLSHLIYSTFANRKRNYSILKTENINERFA